MTALLPLRLHEATVRKRGARLVGPISLEVGGTGITVIIGPNGSGKTTLLRLMHGLEHASEGRVEWSAPLQDARRRQAFVFQSPIMMRRTVLDCIAYPLRLSGVKRHAARTRARVAAAEVGLGGILGVPAPFISGGEKQKLALARALIREPEILFLDEPCASLDGLATRDIEAQLLKASAAGVRIVMSTHDMGQARRLADEVLFLVGGEVCENRPAGEFFGQPGTPEARAFLRGEIVA